MSGFTKLGLALLLIFVFSLLAFSAELLYVLWYRRRFRRDPSDDPELPGGDSSSSKELLLYFLCWKNQARVEPGASSPEATANPSPATEDIDLAKWRAMTHGPSRVLYTIKEEAESDGGSAIGGVSGVAEEEEEETPFSTPPASPLFYTPSSSPPREAEKVAGNPSTAHEEAGGDSSAEQV